MRLKNTLQKNLKKFDNQVAGLKTKPNAKHGFIWRQAPKIYLAYQAKWNSDQSQIKVCEKSRRIGISWCDAADSVLQAAKQNGVDTFYIGYNKEMAEGYILDCASWARTFNLVVSDIQEELVVENEDKDIITYSIYFASGNKIEALSAKPRSIRSKGKPRARLRIDELAFHDDPKEVLKAAIAFKMWGGKIAIWSTHNGTNNIFNKLVERIKRGELPTYSLHTYTFTDAINDGLYKRICYVLGEEWTLEKQLEYIATIEAEYGVDADEELYCIPSNFNETKFIDKHWFEIVTKDNVPVFDRLVRFWDLAATEKELRTSKKKPDPCNTAGVLYGYSTYTDTYAVLDCVAEAFNPANTNRLMINIASQDGEYVPIVHELEGGASGLRDADNIKNFLSGYMVTAVRPQGDKLLRGKPFASAAKNGRVLVLKGDWNTDYLDELDKVPNGLMDRFDASAGAHNYLEDNDPIQDLINYFND